MRTTVALIGARPRKFNPQPKYTLQLTRHQALCMHEWGKSIIETERSDAQALGDTRRIKKYKAWLDINQQVRRILRSAK